MKKLIRQVLIEDLGNRNLSVLAMLGRKIVEDQIEFRGVIDSMVDGNGSGLRSLDRFSRQMNNAYTNNLSSYELTKHCRLKCGGHLKSDPLYDLCMGDCENQDSNPTDEIGDLLDNIKVKIQFITKNLRYMGDDKKIICNGYIYEQQLQNISGLQSLINKLLTYDGLGEEIKKSAPKDLYSDVKKFLELRRVAERQGVFNEFRDCM